MTVRTLPPRPKVLLVDDEQLVTRAIQTALHKEPFQFTRAQSGAEALEILAREPFDVVVSDERMPHMAGSELLAVVKERHPGVVRIILSGHANLEAAVRAINGAEIYRFLMKPCPPQELALTIREALSVRDSKLEFEAWRRSHEGAGRELIARQFDAALGHVWMAYQPIVRAADRGLYGYEALLRCDSPEWNSPKKLLDAAGLLGRSMELARCTRAHVARDLPRAPESADVFVNVDPSDMSDESLWDGRDPLTPHARRVVVEVTERESLDGRGSLESSVEHLRASGFRVAVDDVGAGYAGLSSLALVIPDVAKFDMELVRDIDASATKRTIVGSMIEMCRSLGVMTLAEGVETEAEFATVVELGCDLVQGYWISPPRRGF